MNSNKTQGPCAMVMNFIIIIEFLLESITAKIEQKEYREWLKVWAVTWACFLSKRKSVVRNEIEAFPKAKIPPILATSFRAFDAAHCSTPNCSSHSVYILVDFRSDRFSLNILIEFNKRVFIVRAIWFCRCHRNGGTSEVWEYRGILSARKAFLLTLTQRDSKLKPINLLHKTYTYSILN